MSRNYNVQPHLFGPALAKQLRNVRKTELLMELTYLHHRCQLPLRHVTDKQAEQLRLRPDFIAVEQYAGPPIAEGEIGSLPDARYRISSRITD